MIYLCAPLLVKGVKRRMQELVRESCCQALPATVGFSCLTTFSFLPNCSAHCREIFAFVFSLLTGFSSEKELRNLEPSTTLELCFTGKFDIEICGLWFEMTFSHVWHKILCVLGCMSVMKSQHVCATFGPFLMKKISMQCNQQH